MMLLYIPVTLLWQEFVVRLWAFGTVRGSLCTLLFSLALGMWMNVLCCALDEKGNRITAAVLITLVTLWMGIQTVYFTIFRTFLTVFSLGGTEALVHFWRETLSGIAQAWFPLMMLLLPAILFFAWGRRWVSATEKKRKAVMVTALGAAALQLAAVVTVNLSGSGVLSPRSLYYEEFIPDLSVSNFGIATTLRLDVSQLVGLERGWVQPAYAQTQPEEETPPPEEPSAEQDSGAEELPEEQEPEVIEYAPNVMEIDFDALRESGQGKTISQLHDWFSQREPTMQNEYTGRFAGKNLLWFTAEGFSRFAVDPEITPTLYKLANSGFVFENFYNPLWWASTIDGEYVACTSMIPKSGAWSLYAARNNSLYFCMGNQLRALGYDTRAYHNHTYTYYNRDQSHPNMGYDYMGVGNGLEVTKQWPESDLEMMEQTLPQIVGEDPFHAYYMTISGHMNYNFGGNLMARKHRDEVGHEEWSEAARAYLACQMELDKALEYTLQYLEETGHLEDTVICLSADHYPYGLEESVLEELNGGEVDMRFDVYRSTLILWSGDMSEPIIVTKPCSSLDILPTLSNLFGVEYDSRLLMGRDALSDSEALVVFSDRSFLTEKGRYDARKGVFVPNDGAEVPEGYEKQLLEEGNRMFSNSRLVLENDYYGKLGLIHETEEP